MKATLEIEITKPSESPIVVNEEKVQELIGLGCRVYITDETSLWAGATWTGKIVEVKEPT
jgi:hypothetical protein